MSRKTVWCTGFTRLFLNTTDQPCDPHQITMKLCPSVSSFYKEDSTQNSLAETNEKSSGFKKRIYLYSRGISSGQLSDCLLQRVRLRHIKVTGLLTASYCGLTNIHFLNIKKNPLRWIEYYGLKWEKNLE